MAQTRFLIVSHQPHPYSGDFAANAQALIRVLEAAADRAAGLPAAVFAPAYALEGPQGIKSLTYPAFSRARAQALAAVSAASKRTGVAVALPIVADAANGRLAPILISDGRVRPIDAGGEVLFESLENPEDGPILRLFDAERRQQADAGVILWDWRHAGEPFTARREPDGAAPGSLFIRTNLGGGEGEHVYTGASVIRSPACAVTGARFDEDAMFVVASIERGMITFEKALEHMNASPMALPADKKLAAVIAAIRDYTHACRASGIVLGISGGIDSALVAAAATAAVGAQNVRGYMLSSRYTSQESRHLASTLVANLGIRDFDERSIEVLHDAAVKDFEEDTGVLTPGEITDQNIQARVRSLRLMAIANKFGALVLCTSNKAECAMGYGTLYGDIAGGFAPIADLWKSEVVALCRAFNDWKGAEVIPEALIRREPTAELRPGQKDSDSLPPYDEIERAVRACMAGEDLAGDASAEAIVTRAAQFAFKRRQAPAGLILSKDSMGAFDAAMGLNRAVRWPAA